MLFHSYEFLFVFGPLAIAGFYALLALERQRWGLAWLLLMSLCFYGWWNPRYLSLIGLSISANYGLSHWLVPGRLSAVGQRLGLIAGVAGNLALLGYFKYAHFLADNLSYLTGAPWSLEQIALPLAISFFTFQQLGYLVDVSRGQPVPEFLEYCLFVTFFPQLIAGPIVQQRDLLPQLQHPARLRFQTRHFEVGLTIFVLGLAKKTLIADYLAKIATPLFDWAARGESIACLDAWTATLAYTLQLYFDFSGYSDMAVGLGWLFGIRLPINFHSPYRAESLIDFWRRWHISLSIFLRDYLYIPLGGSRLGAGRKSLNLLLTMTLGGLWHGAGWTFIIWGLWHGMGLIVNHAWRKAAQGWGLREASFWRKQAGWCLTLVAVMVGWTFFRSADLPTAGRMLSAMFQPISMAFGGEAWPASGGSLAASATADLPLNLELAVHVRQTLGFRWERMALLFSLLAITRWAPNVYEIMALHGDLAPIRMADSAAPALWQWRASPGWALGLAGLTIFSVSNLNTVSEFLYFRF